jgi:acyl transferase domain-containing protein
VSEFLKRIADFSPKRLLLLAAELEERVRMLEGRAHAPIAIVGMGCRFPGGVRDADSFWELLVEGRDAITEVPRWRWDLDKLYDPDPHARGKVTSRWGGFLDSPEFFDPAFFGIAPVEAFSMDPQQRLLLEASWEALEDAAIAPSTLSGSRTGVFLGICSSDYTQLALNRPVQEIDPYFAQGGSHAVATGRISYFLGLLGPSLAIDTACSASLVAIHEACQSLRVEETDLALAGGVNVLFSPEITMALSRAQMMAPDGRCKAFSAAADGFVRSEGCGVLALKRLDDAVRDGDRVLAVIRGTALNQDGRSSGLTAPNGQSQREVIRAAVADAGIAPEAVSYVEAHGTGTNLGDPIEMQALDEALGKGRAENARLPVGSVKTNFGHSEAASGVAGLIKLTLALQHRSIPASLHFDRPNPAIDWENNRLRVPVSSEAWELAAGQETRIGTVSSFGFSGTNAVMVVSEAPNQERTAPSEGRLGVRTIAFSARSETALKTMAARLADRLREDPDLRLEDVAYTLAVGRSAFAHRAAIRPDSKQHLTEELSLLAQNDGEQSDGETEFSRGIAAARAPRVAFLFTGQGAERTGMGRSLLQRFDVFRAAVGEVDAALEGVIPTSIEAIFRNEKNELAESALVQPALFAFQYGMAKLWQSWGVEPHIVVGHSLGEIVAVTVAGAMSVKDAARLVAARGRLTGELADPGGMVAINAAEEQVQTALAPYREEVSIAAINGPISVVISGRSEAVELATREFEREGVRVKRLNIPYGSHSPAMHRVLPALHEEATKAQYRAPRIPILADLTGEKVVDASTFNAQYWTHHLRETVQFDRCLAALEREGCGLCLEMGPRGVLTAFGKERGETQTRWVASANGREDDLEALQAALGEAFTAGATLDWKAVFRADRVRKVALPTYPFERDRYWIQDEDASSRPDTEDDARMTGRPRVPTGNAIATASVDASLQGRLFAEARIESAADGALQGSLLVRDADGVLVASADGIELTPVASAAPAPKPEDWLYEQAWETAQLTEEGKNANKGRHWMVLGERSGLGGTVVEQLLAQGESAEILSDAELHRLAANGSPCEIVDLRLIDMPSIENDSHAESLSASQNATRDPSRNGASIDAAQDRSAAVAKHAQIVGDRTVALTTQSAQLWQIAIGMKAKLWLFTQGAQPVRPSFHLAGGMQAPLWGLARCANLENPGRLRRMVDIDPAFNRAEAAVIVTRELLSSDDEEQIAYAGTSRRAFRIQRVVQPVQAPLAFRKDGSYLLTGGLGGLGMRVSEWLGRQGAGKVVLTTRSLASVEARHAQIEAMQESGLDVSVVQVDVADAEAMQQLMARFGEGAEWPPLRGVFHMAAEIRDALVEKITPDQIRSMFRAKVDGTWVLHELTRTMPLDFLVGFSSMGAVLGANSLGNYSAANSFVDAMASIRATEGLPFHSISWGSWQTVRMASEGLQKMWAASGVLPMDDDAALRCMGDLLQGKLRRATVANVNWEILASMFELRRQRTWLACIRSSRSLPEPDRSAKWTMEPGESRVMALERMVRKEAARILGLRRGELPDSHARLADLGLDSLMAVTLRNRLQLMVQHGLPPTFAFEFPTPAEMAIELDMLVWSSGAAEEENSAGERDEIQI